MKESSANSLSKDLNKLGVTILTFGAKWCRYCQLLKDELIELETENPQLTILHIDTDENEDLAVSYDVSVLPTTLYFVDGVLKERDLGFKKCNEIAQIVKNLQ